MKRIINYLLLFIIAFNLSCQKNRKDIEAKVHAKEQIILQLKKGFPLFDNVKTQKEIIKWQKLENRRFGQTRHQRRYHKVKFKGTTLMQRSGRKRLYDHNIFLRALFQGRIVHRKFGNLGKNFEKAVFVDVGSAILMGDGAPTVRDLYEDKEVEAHLGKIIATDINDPASPSSRYVDIYKKTKNNLPFPVREVPMVLDTETKFHGLTKGFLKKKTPVIYRSANSGPDLFYSSKEIDGHLRAMIRYFYNREVLYFFNKFVLYKSEKGVSFQKIGIIDPSIATSHRALSWEDINWKRRKLQSAFQYNSEHLERPKI